MAPCCLLKVSKFLQYSTLKPLTMIRVFLLKFCLMSDEIKFFNLNFVQVLLLLFIHIQMARYVSSETTCNNKCISSKCRSRNWSTLWIKYRIIKYSDECR